MKLVSKTCRRFAAKSIEVLVACVVFVPPASAGDYKAEKLFNDVSPAFDATPFVTINNSLVFAANGPLGLELFATDGTDLTSFDLNVGPAGSFPGIFGTEGPVCCEFVRVNDRVVFSATVDGGSPQNEARRRLFATDGESVTQLGDIAPTHGSYAGNYFPFGDYVFFNGVGPDGSELYKTDGVTVEQVADINPNGSSSPVVFPQQNESLFFIASDDTSRSLFRMNDSGITKLIDIEEVGFGLFSLNENTFFNQGRTLFKVQENGFDELFDAPGLMGQNTVLGGKLFFVSDSDQSHLPPQERLYRQLYKFDGEEVTQIGDIYDVQVVAAFNDDLYVRGWTGGTSPGGGTSALYKTDGEGLELVLETTGGAVLFELDEELLFRTNTTLFKTDGTSVTEIEIDSPIPIPSNSSNIVELAGDLFYVSMTPDILEVIKFDGLHASSIVELPAVGDAFFYVPPVLEEYNGTLFFMPTLIGDDAHLVEGVYRIAIVPEPSGLLLTLFGLLGLARRFRASDDGR